MSNANLAPDVVRLVIAARIVAFEDKDEEAIKELDEASEAFADRVPWDDEPSEDTALSTPNAPVEPTTAQVEWLEDAARYFEARPTLGEDMAHWANVHNAEMCRKIAAILAVRLDEAAIRKDEREKCDSYRNALLWAFDRLSVSGGMDADTQRRTMREIGNVLTGRTSPAATYQPNDDDDSVKLASAIRNGGKQP